MSHRLHEFPVSFFPNLCGRTCDMPRSHSLSTEMYSVESQTKLTHTTCPIHVTLTYTVKSSCHACSYDHMYES